MATRSQATAIVINILCKKYGLTPKYFNESDSLKKDWGFQQADYLQILYEINIDASHPALVTPPEIFACPTIGKVIDLVLKKLKK